MLENNNLQKKKKEYLLQSKKRMKFFLSFFSIIFIFYYFNIIEGFINFCCYYFYFLDFYDQIQNCFQTTETIYSNIQQLNESHQQLLERLDTNQNNLMQTLTKTMKVTSSKNISPYLTPLKPSYFKL
jgi:hypothetical protein